MAKMNLKEEQMSLWTGGYVLVRVVSAIYRSLASGTGTLRAAVIRFASHSPKVVASFLFAPVLLVVLACRVKDFRRRIVAVVGLLLSLAVAYFTGTPLGTWITSVFVAEEAGFLFGILYWFAAKQSYYFNVFVSILVIDTVSFLFLRFSSQEVVDHLEEQTT